MATGSTTTPWWLCGLLSVSCVLRHSKSQRCEVSCFTLGNSRIGAGRNSGRGCRAKCRDIRGASGHLGVPDFDASSAGGRPLAPWNTEAWSADVHVPVWSTWYLAGTRRITAG